VDLARLTPQQNTEPEISGGYMIKKDKDSPGDLNFSTQGGGSFSVYSGPGALFPAHIVHLMRRSRATREI
jgi:hypothetical protein